MSEPTCPRCKKDIPFLEERVPVSREGREEFICLGCYNQILRVVVEGTRKSVTNNPGSKTLDFLSGVRAMVQQLCAGQPTVFATMLRDDAERLLGFEKGILKT